ncbi:MAG: hypothetical protein DME25_16800 [Verrucomicrobia bacterium]|nr:MAG: hypothetical protein DME25_16800 [Verrucomicrobiota bacterium]
MDPDIVQHPAYREELPDALQAIPTLSLVMDPVDLFSPARGLYCNPLQSGDDWERPGSVELIFPDDRTGFQVDCGVRIQGGWNRRPEESPKHAFRLAFRQKYGSAKLKFRLFERAGTEEFDGLILRAGCNNTWLHWSSQERSRGDYVRDQWIRDSQAAMGHPSARGTFVHFYLNGLYWGLYNLTERPNEHFAADHFGGKPKDYDARNGDHVLSGDDSAWKQMVSLANAGLRSAKSYETMEELLDVTGFIDFMVLNLYGANADWDHASNWYAARRRRPPGPFHFFVWDAERTLEGVEADTLAFDDDQSPPRLFHKLRENAEFRLQFADRVHRHLFNDGALTPAAAASRFRALSDRLDKAIVAESARWGDYRRDVHPYKVGPYALYTRDEHWRPEIERLLKEYFPQRTAVLLQQFCQAGLYPAVAAPMARRVDRMLVLSAPTGLVFYTDDGRDPRQPGDQLAAGARKYERPVPAQAGRTIKARTAIGQGSSLQWSALAEFLADP